MQFSWEFEFQEEQGRSGSTGSSSIQVVAALVRVVVTFLAHAEEPLVSCLVISSHVRHVMSSD